MHTCTSHLTHKVKFSIYISHKQFTACTTLTTSMLQHQSIGHENVLIVLKTYRRTTSGNSSNRKLSIIKGLPSCCVRSKHRWHLSQCKLHVTLTWPHLWLSKPHLRAFNYDLQCLVSNENCGEISSTNNAIPPMSLSCWLRNSYAVNMLKRKTFVPRNNCTVFTPP